MRVEQAFKQCKLSTGLAIYVILRVATQREFVAFPLVNASRRREDMPACEFSHVLADLFAAVLANLLDKLPPRLFGNLLVEIRATGHSHELLAFSGSPRTFSGSPRNEDIVILGIPRTFPGSRSNS